MLSYHGCTNQSVFVLDGKVTAHDAQILPGNLETVLLHGRLRVFTLLNVSGLRSSSSSLLLVARWTFC